MLILYISYLQLLNSLYNYDSKITCTATLACLENVFGGLRPVGINHAFNIERKFIKYSKWAVMSYEMPHGDVFFLNTQTCNNMMTSIMLNRNHKHTTKQVKL